MVRSLEIDDDDGTRVSTMIAACALPAWHELPIVPVTAPAYAIVAKGIVVRGAPSVPARVAWRRPASRGGDRAHRAHLGNLGIS